MLRVLSIVVAAVFLVIGIAAEPTGALATEKIAATKFIDGLRDSAFNVHQAKELSPEQKEARVRSLLSENFNLKLIGRFVLGSSWRKATTDQRTEYMSLFKKFMVETYARRIGDFSGQKLRVIGAKPIGKKDVLVQTLIERPSGPPIKAGWRVRSYDGDHFILDLIVGGVSMIVAQRSEFRSVVRRQGVDGLIKTLRVQVAASVSSN